MNNTPTPSYLYDLLTKYSNLTVIQEILSSTRLNQKQQTKILVLGEFSTGKSTFINALLQGNYAVSSAIPTTSVITRFEYGAKHELIINYNNGTSKHLSIKQLEKYTVKVDGKNSSTLSNIKYVVRKIPHPLLKHATLIDSPGLNDTDEAINLSADTKAQIKQADIIFWLFSAQNLGKLSELEAIKQVYYYTGIKPQAVINQIDWIDEEEDDLDELLNDFQHKFGEHIDKIFPLSSLEALAGRDPEHLNSLLTWIDNNLYSGDACISDTSKILELILTKILIPFNQQQLDSSYLSFIKDLLLLPEQSSWLLYNQLLSLIKKYITNNNLSDISSKIKLTYDNEGNEFFFSEKLLNLYMDIDLLSQNNYKSDIPTNSYEAIKKQVTNILKDGLILYSKSAFITELADKLYELMLNWCDNDNYFSERPYDEIEFWYNEIYTNLNIPYAIMCLGSLYGCMDNPKYNISIASQYFKQYIEAVKTPEDKLLGLEQLICLYFDAELYTTAIDYCKNYLAINSSSVAINTVLGLSYCCRDDSITSYESALKYLNKAYRGSESDESIDDSLKNNILTARIELATQLLAKKATKEYRKTLTTFYLEGMLHSYTGEQLLPEFIKYVNANELYGNILKKNLSYTDTVITLGKYFYQENNYDWAFKFLKLANQLDNYTGCFKLAYMYNKGLGTAQNFELAFKYYNKDIDKNKSPASYNNIGILYENGEGTTKDAHKAFKSYKTAARLHSAYGNYNLALCYMNGTGCAMNKKLGFKHMLKASNLKNPTADRYLALYYLAGDGCHPNLVKCKEALQRYAKYDTDEASKLKQDIVEKLSYLNETDSGLTYLQAQNFHYGCFTDINLEVAKELYTLAAQLGNPYAIRFLYKSYFQNTGIAVSYKEITVYDKLLSTDEQSIITSVKVKAENTLLESIKLHLLGEKFIFISIALFITILIYNYKTLLTDFWYSSLNHPVLTTFIYNRDSDGGALCSILCLYYIAYTLYSINWGIISKQSFKNIISLSRMIIIVSSVICSIFVMDYALIFLLTFSILLIYFFPIALVLQFIIISNCKNDLNTFSS